MRHHGAVGKLDHRVNLGLTLHDHVNEIEVAVKQVHGLDALQALVHEGGGVDGDLGTHGPRGSVARASARVTRLSSSRVRPKNGPPEQVSQMQWASRGFSPR